MSELLEEARERRDKAELSTESPSYNWLNDSYYLGEQNAWREAVELIEKHEKPEGLTLKRNKYKEAVETGQKIKSARIAKGLSMEQLGERLTPPASKGAVSNWENGYNLPTEKRNKQLQSILDTYYLTDKQQEIYEYFKQGYKEFDDEDESINDTMENFSIALGGKDEDIVPALKKFLSEVEE